MWPWEAVPVASVATSRGYSSCAARCQPLGSQGGVPWGHIPCWSQDRGFPPSETWSFVQRNQIDPQSLGKDVGKPLPLHITENKAGGDSLD